MFEDYVIFDTSGALLESRGRSFHSPGGSMTPTLRPGDYFMIRVQRSENLSLRHGDIVVFRGRNGIEYVKRVIGLPGDRISLHENRAQLLGVDIRHDTMSDAEKFSDVCMGTGPRYREIWPDQRGYPICTLPYSRVSNVDAVVPLGHVYVLGDFRANSLDSRMPEMGPVPLDQVLGKATYIYWSKDLGRIGLRLD